MTVDPDGVRLLACPFCDASIDPPFENIRDAEDRDDTEDDFVKCHTIKHDCGTTGDTIWIEGKDSADCVRKWNTRVAPVPQRDAEPVAWRWKYKDCPEMKWIVWSDFPGNEIEIITEPLYAAPARCDAGNRNQIIQAADRTDRRTIIGARSPSEAWLETFIGEMLAATPPALPAGEEMQFDPATIEECLEAARPFLIQVVPGTLAEDIRQAIRALSPSSNGKPATENAK